MSQLMGIEEQIHDAFPEGIHVEVFQPRRLQAMLLTLAGNAPDMKPGRGVICHNGGVEATAHVKVHEAARGPKYAGVI